MIKAKLVGKLFELTEQEQLDGSNAESLLFNQDRWL